MSNPGNVTSSKVVQVLEVIEDFPDKVAFSYWTMDGKVLIAYVAQAKENKPQPLEVIPMHTTDSADLAKR